MTVVKFAFCHEFDYTNYMDTKKFITTMNKITYIFEVVIAFALLAVIAIKIIEISAEMLGINIVILAMDFERILSSVLTLVIGVEFIKMLCKHTPETVIDVLLFAIARHIVIYHDSTLDLLIGAVAIAGLFAAKKFFADKTASILKKELEHQQQPRHE